MKNKHFYNVTNSLCRITMLQQFVIIFFTSLPKPLKMEYRDARKERKRKRRDKRGKEGESSILQIGEKREGGNTGYPRQVAQ